MKNIARNLSRAVAFTPLYALYLLMATHSLFAQKNASFIARRDYLAADGASTPAVADLNGDGILDAVVPDGNPNTSNVSVLLGNADGTFKPFKLINVGGALPQAVVIADFNGDGKKDLAVTTLAGVAILLGDGHGDFGAPHIFPAGTTPGAIVAGDFNGDGKVDLAVANFDSNDVSVFLGQGNGNFTLATTIAVGMGPGGIAAGDFNGDGHADLAVTNSGDSDGLNGGSNGNTVSIIMGKGNGQFQSPSFIPVSNDPRGIAVADFNHDKKLDLVVTNFAKNKVSVLLGNGNGTFLRPRLLNTGDGPNFVTVDDFNGDGNPDFAVTNELSSSVSVFFGDGKGRFPTFRAVEVGRSPVAVIAGDFNRDGKPDLLSSNKDANTISVVFGNGNGTFRAAPSFAAGFGTNQMISADFNHDGQPDLATANTASNSVSVILGNKDGSFGANKIFAVGTNPATLAAADFDKDGNVDLVVANGGKFPKDAGSVSLLRGNGDGTFQPAVTVVQGSFITGVCFLPDAIAVGDFNGDGNPDFAVACGNILIFLGDGKGGFTQAPVVSGASTGGIKTAGLMTADFNHDGKTDLAVLGGSGLCSCDGVFVLLGNGDGTIASLSIPVTASPTIPAYAIGDFNNDGIPDFAVEEGGQIEMLMGDGKGNFTSVGKFRETQGAQFSVTLAITVGDFNGDGFLDVASADSFADDVNILLGRGNGTLESPGQLFGGAVAGFGGMVAADFNGDHRTDLAVAAGSVAVLLNNTH